jgi:hypothetical protein
VNVDGRCIAGCGEVVMMIRAKAGRVRAARQIKKKASPFQSWLYCNMMVVSGVTGLIFFLSLHPWRNARP